MSTAVRLDSARLAAPSLGPGAAADIPPLRPLLPKARRLSPYLARIDAARSYSNFGALSLELQARLGSMFAVERDSVFCTSSGTSALVAATVASAGRAKPERKLAMIPGLTFPATAAAAEQCGYASYLLDVDEHTWLLDPDKLLSHPRLDQTGLVMPVATFGRPVPQEPWQRFTRATGIPVVIDGAASFSLISQAPRQYLGSIPVAVSFHATKSFGVGEGGCLFWDAPDAEQRVCEALNFGFYRSRLSVSPGGNAKMSEYHAAVGLAELDGWEAKVASFQRVVTSYARAASRHGLARQLITYPRTDYIYPHLACSTAEDALRVQGDFADHGIGFRRWYGDGMLAHPQYAGTPHDRLEAATDLASRLIGLPMAPDLRRDQADRVMHVASSCLTRPVAVPAGRPYGSAAKPRLAKLHPPSTSPAQGKAI